MKDAQQDVIEGLWRDLFVARETADRCEERYHSTRALVHVGVQKVEVLEKELERSNKAGAATQRHMNLCRDITKCPDDETLAVWLEKELSARVRLDDPVVKGLVEALKEHSNSMVRVNALAAYNAKCKEVGCE